MNSSFFDGDCSTDRASQSEELGSLYGEEEVVSSECDQHGFLLAAEEVGDDAWPVQAGGAGGVVVTAENSSPMKCASLQQQQEILQVETRHHEENRSHQQEEQEDEEVEQGGEDGDVEYDDDDLSNLIMVANEEEDGVNEEDEDEAEELEADEAESDEDTSLVIDERGKEVARAGRNSTVTAGFGGTGQQQQGEEQEEDVGQEEDDDNIVSSPLALTSKRSRRDPASSQSRLSAYMLFSREMRSSVTQQYPELSFSEINKQLGVIWNSLSQAKKYNYRRRVLRLSQRQSAPGGARMKSTGRWSGARAACSGAASDDAQSCVSASEPLDLAAHLLLLGESLQIIGRRLCDREGHIAVQGALSVVLDSLMCALVPLVALTSQVRPLQDACDLQGLQQALDNVAYFMPGL